MRLPAVVLATGFLLVIGATSSAAPVGVVRSAPEAHFAPPPGSIGLRLVDVPLASVTDPRARLYVIDHMAPGAVISRRIEISNTTSAIAVVALYAAGASIAAGSFLGAAGHTVNELSSWTSVRPGTANIPAGGVATATVRITVPADAAPGERYAVAWAEVDSKPAAGGVTQVSRVGLRLYISVGPGNAPADAFTIDTLTAGRSADGRPTVLASVHNTGGRALDVTGSLRLLAGPGGLSAGPFPAVLATTLGIGDTERVSILLDRSVPDGPWDARITLRSGLLERAARATITFSAAGPGQAVATHSGRRPGWLYPAIAASVALALVLAIVLLLRRRRDRRSADLAQPTDSAGVT